MKRYLICTDLDRTLIPNGAQPESPGARHLFRLLAEREDVALAYVSGRHRELIGEAITEFGLPQPDYAIADVGSTIYRADPHGTGDWTHWMAWEEAIAPDWHGLSHDRLYALLNVYPQLRLQEPEKQGRYKLSFYAEIDGERRRMLDDMDARLKQQGIRANLIWSVDEARGVGLLDVLPATANKRHAINFLMRREGYRNENTLFAGDSGNDLDVLMSDIPSVLVANAPDEVKACAEAADPATLHVAKGDFVGMNGNYAAGILEGVAHYWPEIGEWLRAQQTE